MTAETGVEAVEAAEDAPEAVALPPVARHQRTLPKLADPDAPLLVVEDLKTYFTLESGTVKAVDGVSFTARAGRGARHRRRVRLRQDDDRAVAGAAPAVQRERSSAAASS